MNKYTKKSAVSYKFRGLYSRKLKTKMTMQDLINLYIPKNWEQKITITTL